MAVNKKLKQLWELLLQLIFPLRCPVCDEIVKPFGQKICPACRKRFKYVTSPWCFKCGKQLEDKEQEYCADCKRIRHLFIGGRALYEYESVSASIYRFKYHNRREYADFFGEEVSLVLGQYISMICPDALIPIPLHSAKRRKRGYNQAQILAKSISRYTGVPVYDKILIRTRNTIPLKQLNPQERQNNLKKAFNIRGNDVKLKTVIIIDDIYTTGSTMDAAASVLLEAGVRNVYFMTLACGRGL